MNQQQPTVDAYVQLFDRYGDDLGSLYRAPNDDRYALLFEQVVQLLVKPSAFNLSLPVEFRNAAIRYRDGDPATLAHLRDPANRHFMLCDLHDLVLLKGGLALKRRGSHK